MLQKEAKRFPKVAELIERAPWLTDEEIAAADVPLPWYRNALKQLRDMESYRMKVEQYESAEASSFFKHGVTATVEGFSGLYVGNDAWVKTFECEMLLRSNTLIFFPTKGGMYVDCSFLKGKDQQLREIAQSCRDLTKTDLLSYKRAANQRLVGYHPDAPVLNDPHATAGPAANGAMGRLAGLGVTFS